MSEDAEHEPAEAGSTSATPNDSEGSARRRGKRRARAKAHHTVGKVVLASLIAVGLATGLGVVYIYRHLNDNLNVVNVDEQLKNRPDKKQLNTPKEPLNILVMGSDTRDGEGNNIDNLTGGGERPTPRSCSTSRRTAKRPTASAFLGTPSWTAPTATTRTATRSPARPT